MSYLILKAKRKDNMVKFKIKTSYTDVDTSEYFLEGNLGTMCIYHKNYILGHNHSHMPSPSNYNSYKEYLADNFKKTDVVLPIYMYEHGGIAISTERTGLFADRFDSSHVGFIYVKAETIKKEYGALKKATVEKVKDILEREIEDYNKYLTGELYEVVITAKGVGKDGLEWEDSMSRIVDDDTLKELPYEIIDDYNPEDYDFSYERPYIDMMPEKEPEKEQASEIEAPGM